MKRTSGQEQLAGYGRLLRRLSSDERLSSAHIGLFAGLFIHWQRGGYVSPFFITRRTVMAYSRIASIATYHKCMRELNDYGYMRYQPSYHPGLGSQVYWLQGEMGVKEGYHDDER